MKKRRLLIATFIIFWAPFIYAQDQEKTDEDCNLEMMQRKIKDEVKEELKDRIKTINKKLDKGEITQAKAEKQKKALAELKAKNIEERQEIARLFFQYAQRNDIDDVCEMELPVTKEKYEEWICHVDEKEDDFDFPFNWPELHSKGKFNSKMLSRMIIGFGFNNTFDENDFLGDNNYDLYPSRYFEIGWEWSQRIINKSNWLRFNYGFSFQFNGIKQDDNQFFVKNGEQTELQDFGRNLDKSKFRMTNLIFPLHLELSNSQKIIKEDDDITFTEPSFKFGFGGFFGLNIANMQKT